MKKTTKVLVVIIVLIIIGSLSFLFLKSLGAIHPLMTVNIEKTNVLIGMSVSYNAHIYNNGFTTTKPLYLRISGIKDDGSIAPSVFGSIDIGRLSPNSDKIQSDIILVGSLSHVVHLLFVDCFYSEQFCHEPHVRHRKYIEKGIPGTT